MSSSPALLLIAHGTRDPRGADELAELVAHLRARLHGPVEGSWLEEFAEPDARTAAGSLVRAGVSHVVTLPLFTLAGGHAKTDVVGEVADLRAAHPQLHVTHGAVLGLHPGLFALARRRVQDARRLAWGDEPVGGDELLLVTGSGTSDPDANGDLAKAARFLAETTGHRWAETGYAGVTWPRADVALRRAAAAGARRVVRFSWSLLAGLLEQRIDAWADEVAAATGLQIVDAGRFGPVEAVADVVAERFREALDGPVRMNCDLCQFRLPLPGREKRAGLPSAGGTGERVRDDARAIHHARAGTPGALEWKGA